MRGKTIGVDVPHILYLIRNKGYTERSGKYIPGNLEDVYAYKNNILNSYY